MIFNKHFDLRDKHAILSASKYHWINYSAEKMADVFVNLQAAKRGSELHAFAHEAIRLGIKQRETAQTLNMYINDAIGFRMSPEQILVYSPNAFGTADAIGFSNGVLRVHDLKTGINPGSEHQLEVYAALFCLEYNIKPFDIQFELRLYQNDEIIEFDTDPQDILYIMDRIIEFDKLIETMKSEEV